jgi:PAS domain S-box-containing protein
MAMFLLSASAMMLILLGIDLAERLTGFVTTSTWLIADVSMLACMAGLFVLNRRGHVLLAAVGAIVQVIGATALLMQFDTLNNSLVLLAVPIVLSSFVAFPAASLGTAILAILTYTLMNVLQQSRSYFNYFGVLALFLLAATIWMVSAWLERALREAREAEADLRRDIVKRERAEAVAAASEQRLHHVVNSNVDGMLVVSADGLVRFANPAAGRLLGRSDRELLNRTIDLPLDDQATTEAVIAEANGSLRTIEIHLADITWEDQPARLAALRDVTTQRQVEAALRTSEDRFRRVVQNLGEGVGIVDLSERFVFANAAAEQIFGMAPGQLVGRTLAEFVDADHLRQILTQTQRRLRGQASTYEIEITRPDGDRRNILITGTPHRNAENAFVGSLGIFFDITDRKRAEAALQASEARARALVEEQLAANVQLERYYQDTVSIDQVSRALAATLDAPTIYRVLYRDIVHSLLGAAHLMVELYDEQTRTIRCGYAVIDGQEVDPARFPTYPLGVGPTSDTVRTREARIIDLEAMRVELEPQGRAVRIGDPTDQAPMSALYAPLLRGDKVVGVLSVQHYEHHAFTDRHILLLTTVANQVAVALTNAELFATLEHRVTERTAELQTVNEALRTSEERLRAVSEATPVPLVITRLSDTAILSANSPLCEMFGVPPERIIGQLARNFIIDQRTFRQLVLEVHRTGVVRNAEVEAAKATGERFWVVVAMRKMTFADEPALVTGFYDVTERKQAEQAVLDSEEKFRSVIEQSRDGILLADERGYIVEWNRGLEEIIGWPRAHMLGRRLDQAGLHSAMNMQPVTAAIERLRASVSAGSDPEQLAGMNRLIEQDFTRSDGARRTLQVRLFPIQLEKTAMFCAIIRDITERIHIERALRDSEEHFRQIAENIREVFWMSTPDKSRVLYVSPAYEETWGRTCASLYADPASYFEAVHPDDRPRVDAYFDRQRQGVPVFAEYRIVRPDGTIGWIWDRAFPIHNEAGQVVRMVGVAEDVTSRKQAEEELRRALQTETELGELKSRFISMTSHEFRTPLAGILSAAELLEHYSHKWPDDKKLRYLRQIQTNVTTMNQLLEEVLIISKDEANKTEFRPARLNVDEFSRELVEQVQLSHPTHIIHYSSDLPDRRMLLDEQLLRRILINLLANAIKYSPAADAIEFDVSQRGDELVFRITDHGLGIPSEAHTRLFETFYRAGNVAGIQGTGLGLSIVKKAVELHGGSIEFTSEVDRGSTFRVMLPAH